MTKPVTLSASSRLLSLGSELAALPGNIARLRRPGWGFWIWPEAVAEASELSAARRRPGSLAGDGCSGVGVDIGCFRAAQL